MEHASESQPEKFVEFLEQLILLYDGKKPMDLLKEKKRRIKRREFLKMSGLAGAASLLASCRGNEEPQPTLAISPSLTPTEAAAKTPAPQLAVRLAHITDMHIPEDRKGTEQFSSVLKDLQSINPPIDFVLNTGDCVMDALGADKPTALAEWDAFQSVLKSDYPIPIYHAIGNHDVWGWGLSAEERTRQQNDPLFGKGLPMQKLGLAKPYYAFDKGSWHFIVLDDTHLPEVRPSTQPYTGKLDEEQYNWLVGELKATPATTPICIASHIPIFGACSLLDSDESSGSWVMPGAWQHIDGRKLIALFWQHRNVQLCLSGHTHQIEDLRYHGVKYINSGAICGNWWDGAYHDFAPAYLLINLYKDGSSESEIVYY